MSPTAPRPASEVDPSFDPLRDRVFVNGHVVTLDEERPTASALAVRGGRILAVGGHDEVLAAAGRDAERVDLAGRTLLPGFHDAHVHLTMHGFSLTQVPLGGTRSLAEAVARVRARAAELPLGRWIVGNGFALQRWGTRSPDRAALDEAAPDHPVLLRSQDHHSGLANARALQEATVGADTPDPAGGTFERRADGTPSGLLLERAVDRVAGAMPEPMPAAFEEALRAGGRHLASLGVTTVHHMAYEPASHWRALAALASCEDFPVRVWACLPQERIEEARAIGVATGQGGRRFTVGGAKFFVDGALGSLSAWMDAPYGGTDSTGIILDGPEALRERVPLAIRAGLTPVAHAIGDAAVGALVDVLDDTAALWRAAGLRPRIEHAQHVRLGDVARIGRLGLVASMQPLHLTFDAPTIRERLADREDRAYPVRGLLDAGARVAFGSDTPVAPPDVIDSLRAAVTRRGMHDLVIAPQHAVTPEEAVWAYTRGAAAAIQREGTSGVLRRGADADLVAMTADPTRALPDDLAVGFTAVGGRFTYRA
ncbi:MAG: amidohydrolase [Trueperaceae bacterium]|nr:amidohydrolase [Trueperaceae bacterium]